METRAPEQLVVGNWKSHFTVQEALAWLEQYGRLIDEMTPPLALTPVICAPFTVLYPLARAIEQRGLRLVLGAQDLSPVEDGSFTGEVSGRMLQGLVNYVLVGHSERRRFFGDSPKMVKQKFRMALRAGLTPILCAASLAEVPLEARDDPRVAVMYEPPTAISQQGCYRALESDAVSRIVERWRSKFSPETKLFYGGSVNPGNVVDLLRQGGVDGVVAGNASLKPELFVELLQRVSSLNRPPVSG